MTCFLVCLGFLFNALISSFIKFYNFVTILELRCMETCPLMANLLFQMMLKFCAKIKE